ncbi:MAG: carboxymuconolactone decarboxylase family protein [Planctomycetota bacterium]
MASPLYPRLPGLETLLSEPGLAPASRCLALALGAVATSRFEAAENAFDAALEQGASPLEVLEIAASAHLFAGFPRGINGLEACHRALSRRAADFEVRMAAVENFPAAGFGVRGRRLFEAIYASGGEEVLDQLGRLFPPFRGWILEHAYGQVLAREGASGRLRETAAVGALVVLDVPRQLRSHIRGALRLGATPPEVAAVVRTMDLLATPVQAESARAALAAEGITPPPRLA